MPEGSTTSTIIYLSIMFFKRRAHFFHVITEIISFLIGNLITLMKKLLNFIETQGFTYEKKHYHTGIASLQ